MPDARNYRGNIIPMYCLGAQESCKIFKIVRNFHSGGKIVARDGTFSMTMRNFPNLLYMVTQGIGHINSSQGSHATRNNVNLKLSTENYRYSHLIT